MEVYPSGELGEGTGQFETVQMTEIPKHSLSLSLLLQARFDQSHFPINTGRGERYDLATFVTFTSSEELLDVVTN